MLFEETHPSMNGPGIAGVIGTIAAVCTTGAFIPQIVKIRKQGGEDLSYSMLAVYLFGTLLWLLYGLIFHAAAVIWANLVGSVLITTSLILKATWRIAPSGGVHRDRLSRPRIAVDMDEVIADTLTRHLSLYNVATGENLTPELIRERGLNAAICPKYREVFESLPHQSGFFDDLGVIPNSQRALQLLSLEFEIFITSAAMEVPFSFNAKFRWLQMNFPFIPTSNIVFCGEKGIINADYLVDDSSRHFARFRGIGILFAAPHNARERARLRANGWDEVVAILMNNNPSSILGSGDLLRNRSCKKATIELS
jgi:5'-nucleotidase